MIDIEKELKKHPKLQKGGVLQKTLSKFAKSIIHQDEINEFLAKHSFLGPFEFIDAVLEYLNFDFHINNKQKENIPVSGKLVIISNHPLGGLDALVLIKLISSVRKDIKVVANDFLEQLEPLKPILAPINNFKKQQTKDSIANIYNALGEDKAIIIFPSGEVSRATATGIKDKAWYKGFLNFAQRTQAPILPVFIGGKNSKTFYTVSTINQKLATMLLSHEMFKQKSNSIEIIIGELIPHEHIMPKGIDKSRLVDLYKKHVYGLQKNKSFFVTQKAIAHPEDRRDIKKELKKAKLLGQTKDNKKIFLYEIDNDDSIVLNELGRLREISFRKVGEGVNKKRDIDKYDRYYKHIILWDDEDLEIVGAYRIGVVSNIVKKYSKKGLYINTLFEFNKNFKPYLKHSIELGRSFVQPKYWGSRALDYLWYGIGAYLRNNPNIKYMFGPVSLSGAYPKVAKDIIIYFYNLYFHDNQNLVTAKTPYYFDDDELLIRNLSNDIKKEDYKSDFRTLKLLLGALNVSVPTLYKQYSDLCEEGGVKFCAYNVDSDFSDCIDSFILVEVDKIKDAQKKRYIQEK
jgi:putative hemolysin